MNRRNKIEKILCIVLSIILIITLSIVKVKLRKASLVSSSALIKISTITSVRSYIKDEKMFKVILEDITESDNTVINNLTYDKIKDIFSEADVAKRNSDLNNFIESELRYFNTVNTLIDILNIVIDILTIFCILVLFNLISKWKNRKESKVNEGEIV